VAGNCLSSLPPVDDVPPGLDGQFLVTGVNPGTVTPDQITGLVVWLRETVVLNAGNVSQWTDKSGNGNHAVQATPANQPLYHAANPQFNGLASLDFNGTTTFLQAAGLVQAQPYTVYVIGFSSTFGAGVLLGSATNFYIETHGGLYSLSDGLSFADTATSFGTTPHVLCATMAGAGGDVLYLDDPATAAATSGTNGTPSLNVLSIGGAGASAFLLGSVAEVIAYSGVHTAAQRASVFAYLGARYGVMVVGAALMSEWVYPFGDVAASHSVPGLITVTGIESTPVSSTAPVPSSVLIMGATQWAPQLLTGDISLSIAGLTIVRGLETTPLSSTPPAVGNLLVAQPITPTAIANLSLWLRADLGTHVGGGNITQWDDQSGNGLNVTNVGVIPWFVGGGPNGTARLVFGGAQKMTSGSNVVPAGTTRTVFAVMKNSANGGAILAFRSGGPYLALYYDFSTPTDIVAGDGTNPSNTATDTQDALAHMLTFGYVSGSAITYSVDGNAKAIAGGTRLTDSGAAGFEIADDPVGTFFTGEIYEIIVYGRALTAAEINQIGGYIAGRYALTIAGSTTNAGSWAPEPMSGDATISASGVVTVSGRVAAHGFVSATGTAIPASPGAAVVIATVSVTTTQANQRVQIHTTGAWNPSTLVGLNTQTAALFIDGSSVATRSLASAVAGDIVDFALQWEATIVAAGAHTFDIRMNRSAVVACTGDADIIVNAFTT
jgi:hypothetical protein